MRIEVGLLRFNSKHATVELPGASALLGGGSHLSFLHNYHHPPVSLVDFHPGLPVLPVCDLLHPSSTVTW